MLRQLGVKPRKQLPPRLLKEAAIEEPDFALTAENAADAEDTPENPA
ncbi:MAG: hypothetical protein ACRD27_01880 [Terracidiphilus sp.]